MRMPAHQCNSAFSHKDVIVVGVIVCMLGALAFPAVQAARESARKMSCGNNLKQLGLGMHNYHDTYRRFPSGWLAAHPDDPSGADSWAWSVMLIPFLE